MWELEKAVLITNNDRVYEKYKDQLQVILLKTYEEVLIKARDMAVSYTHLTLPTN